MTGSSALIQTMRVIFRADASLQIGTGHVMRCLTLADTLRERAGVQSHFICRAHPGHLADTIRMHGHRVTLLPPPDESQLIGESMHPRPAHAAWLGVGWEVDGDQTLAALKGEPTADWLVVDHYALDSNWEGHVRGVYRGLMVIDDLADRHHDCDLLVDQNLGRQAVDYSGLLPESCVTLIGPEYALLRLQFACLRPESLARRKSPKLQRVLISLGGVDGDNVTGEILRTLRKGDLPEECQLTVVLGTHAPWLRSVRQLAATLPWHTDVLVNVGNMARLMADSDLSIGAAGGTAWERCCLGLPTVMLVLADNQRAAAVALGERVVLLGSLRDVADGLSKALGFAQEHLARLSMLASELVDGRGVERVQEAMETHAVCRTH